MSLRSLYDTPYDSRHALRILPHFISLRYTTYSPFFCLTIRAYLRSSDLITSTHVTAFRDLLMPAPVQVPLTRYSLCHILGDPPTGQISAYSTLLTHTLLCYASQPPIFLPTRRLFALFPPAAMIPAIELPTISVPVLIVFILLALCPICILFHLVYIANKPLPRKRRTVTPSAPITFASPSSITYPPSAHLSPSDSQLA